MKNIKYHNNLVGLIFHCLAGSGPSVYVYFCGASHLICQPFCRKQRQAAVKVLVGEFVGDTTGWGERGILQVLRDHNSQALGYGHVCQLLDDFVLQGPNGSHICIVTEAMGPTVFIYISPSTVLDIYAPPHIETYIQAFAVRSSVHARRLQYYSYRYGLFIFPDLCHSNTFK